jgi:hypothetical protein
MANQQNLRPFPKGVSGNPKGRPKKGRLFEKMTQIVDANPDELEEICKMWLARIKAGDFQFFREFIDRSDGKAVPMEESLETHEGEELGILVKVPTVKQAERKLKKKRPPKPAKRSKGPADASRPE